MEDASNIVSVVIVTFLVSCCILVSLIFFLLLLILKQSQSFSGTLLSLPIPWAHTLVAFHSCTLDISTVRHLSS